MSLVGRWLAIQSFKHDGALHRSWDRGLVLESTPDYIVVATRKAKVIENNGRHWFTHEPAVSIFSKKDWWNVICMFKKEGICYYCNIASPTIIEDSIIKYIDYDLDAKLFTNKTIKVLDENEYKHHRETYKYNDDLDLVLKNAIAYVVNQMKEGLFPFDDNKVIEYFEKFKELTKKEK